MVQDVFSHYFKSTLKEHIYKKDWSVNTKLLYTASELSTCDHQNHDFLQPRYFSWLTGLPVCATPV